MVGHACKKTSFLLTTICPCLSQFVFFSCPPNCSFHSIPDTANMPSPQYNASTSSLPLEHVFLSGHDPCLPVLFRVLGHHPLHDRSLASGSTFVFFCDTSVGGQQRDAEYYEGLQVPSGSLQDIDNSGTYLYFDSVYIYIMSIIYA